MSPKTQAALAAIEAAVAEGQQRIAPATFSHFFGRAATSAAFRMAKASGLIEVAYTSTAGTPVYRPAGPGKAVTEDPAATKH
jgi:hypothetical protein